MSKQFSRRLLSAALCLCLVFGMCASALAAPPDMPPDMPGGAGGPGGPGGMAPPPGGGSHSFYYAEDEDGFIQTELQDGVYTNTLFPEYSQADSFGNSVRARDYRRVSLINPTITKTAGTFSGGDDASFYGVNSGLLICDNADVSVEGGTVLTDNKGANGVFAYGDASVRLTDTAVVTRQNASGGIMVAGGGTLYADNLNVWTEGGSSAAIRSDRGSGLMVVDSGAYVSNGSLGTGSPAIYCVADITVSNAVLIARNAQAMCFEGRNPGKLYNCYLEGNYTASDDDEACNVMVYQSMSGDAAEGTSYFTMVGGVLKDNCQLENAKMFYTTNTYCYISLADVDIQYAGENEPFLLCACNTNRRGWGTAGANGSECGLYCVSQDVSGDIIYDTYSYLSCFFTQGSRVENAIYAREDNGSRGCDVYLDASSSWTLTGDSLVRDLYTGGAAITGSDGKAVSITAPDGTVYAQGDSACTLTVTGTYSTEDHSAQSYMPAIGTAEAYTFDPEALAEEYFSSDFNPAEVNADSYTEPVLAEAGTLSPDESYEAGLNSSPTVVISTQALTVDGKAADTAAYNCDGANYFKLRDLASLLNGTDAQFAVSYNAESNAVEILTDAPYQAVGGELTALSEPTKILISPQSILINGQPADLDVYSINDNNYFKLRDLADVLGFGVNYDEASRTIAITTAATQPVYEKPADTEAVYLASADTQPITAE